MIDDDISLRLVNISKAYNKNLKDVIKDYEFFERLNYYNLMNGIFPYLEFRKEYTIVSRRKIELDALQAVTKMYNGK